MQYLGTDDAGTNSFSLQDFEPSFGSKMNAAVRESWLESYGPVAKDWWNSSAGGDGTKRLSAAEAQDYAKANGGGAKLGITPKDGQYTAEQWGTIVSRQRELAAVKDVRERTPWDMGSVVRGGAMFGAGIVDPINVATAFVPWTRMVGVARGLHAAAMAESALTRAGARAGLGAIDGGISTAVLEPAYAYARSELGDDYGALDSMANIGFGTAFGGGLHVLGGAAGDALRAYRGTASPMVTPNPSMDTAAPLAGAAAGLDTRIKVGDTYEPARWSVVEADALSATVDKADNQFRDRSRPAYQAEIQSRANSLDPALLLGDSPVMDIGAPTLAADGRIVGGNGRTLFISKAYEIGKGSEYRAALESRLADLGIDVDAVRGMQKPVLVRQFTRDVDVKRAAMLSNEGGATDMSPLEQSKVDAERLGDARLSVSSDGDINNAENRAAIRKWVEAQPENKRNSIMDADGKLSPEGLRRLNGAMLFKAYGDTPVLSRLIEAVDPGSRNLALALGRTAPVVAGTRQAIAAGDLHPLDIAADLQLAVEKYNQIRAQNMKVSDYMAQLDAFGDGLTPEATMLLDFMGRNIQSPRRIMDAITGFADRLTEAGNPKQSDMFGAAPLPDKVRMLQDAIDAAETGLDSAADVVAGLAPETREASLRASVAQSLDGRSVDVEPIIGMDESRQSHTMDDVTSAADRNFEPENMALADVEAAAVVQARVDAAPKWDGVKDAEAALADADALLADTVKAGDQAFKYSREQAEPQTEMPAFKEWFGASNVVDETGAPLVVYHGTGADFTVFRKGRDVYSGLNTGEDSAGFFFTTEPWKASAYAESSAKFGGGNASVMPVFLSIKNPLYTDASDLRHVFLTVDEVAKIERDGYDGLIYKHGDDKSRHEYIAFRPEQIKSATGNRGTFDPSNPDITYSRGIPTEQAPGFLTESLRQSFGNSTERLLDEGRVQIVATPADIPGGPHPADVKAATAPDGTVYVVASNVSELEARGILVHEVGVHVGMEKMLGTEVFQSVLSELDDAISRGESWANAARANVPADTPAGLVREEQLAYLVEKSPDLPIVKRIIAAVRAWAYRTFDLARERMTLTEADFQAMAVSALHHAARGEQGGVLQAAFSRGFDVLREVGAVVEQFGMGEGAWRSIDFDAAERLAKEGSEAAGPAALKAYVSDDFMAFTTDVNRKSAATRALVDYVKAMPETTFPELFRVMGFADDAGAQAFLDKIRKGRGGLKTLSSERPVMSFTSDSPVGKSPMENIGQDLAEQFGPQKVIIRLEGGADGMVHGGKDVSRLYSASSKPGVDVLFPADTQFLLRMVEKIGNEYVVSMIPKVIEEENPRKITRFSRGSTDPKYSRGETPDPSTTKDELKPYDDAVKRAKGYAGVLRAAADKLENDADATAAMRAAMPDISPVEIDELLGRLRSQVKGLRGMARTARTAITADDSATLLQTDAMKAADSLANNIMQAAVIEKRNASLNIAARLKATTYLNQFRGAGLDFEGFRGLLVGTERKRAGGRISVDAEQKNFRGEWLGGLIADLEKQDLMRAFASGEFDRDAYRALYNLARDGAGNEKLPKEAVAIAQIVNKYQTDARNTRNRFGAWIRDLQGYITRQSHDMLKIRDVGEQKYKADVLPLLDLERSMRDFDGSADDFLTRVYDDFAAGSHLKSPAGENDMAAFGRGSSLARRESASRVLYFKDGDAAFQYNAKFGQGGLAESVLGGLDNAAKSAGLLKLLGTNPEAAVTRLFDEYADSLRGDPKRRAAFLSHRKEMENLLSHVDGSANIPGNVTAARISSFFRAWQTMSKLGGMLISSVTDLTNYAAELRFGQDKNLLTGTLEGMGALTRGRSSGEKRAVLNSLGVFHESTLGAVFSRFDSPDQLGGKTSWAMQQFFKLTGINWWTESLRDGYALAHTSYMSAQASKSFDKLPTALRDMMGLYNIDAGKWDVLRLANTQQADGRMYITPEGLRTVPRAALANYITQVGRTANDAAIANLQDDLASALRTMTIDRMHHAVIEPGARTRAFMLRGTQPGTVPGEFLRFVTQFKSFPVALIQMTLGREIYGRGYDTLGDYVKRGKGDMLGLASFIALSTAMGYAAMSAKDLLRGKNPRPVDDARTWAAAMVQGGGLGLYGDFLFGKYNRMGGSLTGSLAGPVANLADTAADLWTRIRTGDDFGAVAFNAALQNTPFANLFYTRVALDYLVLYQIQEAMNPGFLRRMERRAERENGQQFYLPPSQVVR